MTDKRLKLLNSQNKKVKNQFLYSLFFVNKKKYPPFPGPCMLRIKVLEIRDKCSSMLFSLKTFGKNNLFNWKTAADMSDPVI